MECLVCRRAAPHRCSACRSAYYCSAEHQNSDWQRHAAECATLAAQNRAAASGSSLSAKPMPGLIPISQYVGKSAPIGADVRTASSTAAQMPRLIPIDQYIGKAASVGAEAMGDEPIGDEIAVTKAVDAFFGVESSTKPKRHRVQIIFPESAALDGIAEELTSAIRAISGAERLKFVAVKPRDVRPAPFALYLVPRVTDRAAFETLERTEAALGGTIVLLDVRTAGDASVSDFGALAKHTSVLLFSAPHSHAGGDPLAGYADFRGIATGRNERLRDVNETAFKSILAYHRSAHRRSARSSSAAGPVSVAANLQPVAHLVGDDASGDVLLAPVGDVYDSRSAVPRYDSRYDVDDGSDDDTDAFGSDDDDAWDDDAPAYAMRTPFYGKDVKKRAGAASVASSAEDAIGIEAIDVDGIGKEAAAAKYQKSAAIVAAAKQSGDPIARAEKRYRKAKKYLKRVQRARSQAGSSVAVDSTPSDDAAIGDALPPLAPIGGIFGRIRRGVKGVLGVRETNPKDFMVRTIDPRAKALAGAIYAVAVNARTQRRFVWSGERFADYVRRYIERKPASNRERYRAEVADLAAALAAASERETVARKRTARTSMRRPTQALKQTTQYGTENVLAYYLTSAIFEIEAGALAFSTGKGLQRLRAYVADVKRLRQSREFGLDAGAEQLEAGDIIEKILVGRTLYHLASTIQRSGAQDLDTNSVFANIRAFVGGGASSAATSAPSQPAPPIEPAAPSAAPIEPTTPPPSLATPSGPSPSIQRTSSGSGASIAPFVPAGGGAAVPTLSTAQQIRAFIASTRPKPAIVYFPGADCSDQLCTRIDSAFKKAAAKQPTLAAAVAGRNLEKDAEYARFFSPETTPGILYFNAAGAPTGASATKEEWIEQQFREAAQAASGVTPTGAALEREEVRKMLLGLELVV